MSIEMIIYCTIGIVIVCAIVGSIGWYLYAKVRHLHDNE